MTFRVTARDARPGGGAIGYAESKVTVAPLAGPFRVTSQPISEVVYGTLSKTITWDVAGTDVAPINVANVKISLVGANGSTVIADEHAQRRLLDRRLARRGADERARQGRGGRQRLLRRLRRRPHLGQGPDAARSAATSRPRCR